MQIVSVEVRRSQPEMRQTTRTQTPLPAAGSPLPSAHGTPQPAQGQGASGDEVVCDVAPVSEVRTR